MNELKCLWSTELHPKAWGEKMIICPNIYSLLDLGIQKMMTEEEQILPKTGKRRISGTRNNTTIRNWNGFVNKSYLRLLYLPGLLP